MNAEVTEQARAALKEISAMYAQTWDRVDGALVMMPESIPRFEAAHEKAVAALASLEAAGAPTRELVLRISQDADSGWWKILGPVGSGLLIAHPSLDVCVADILPSWRGMAKLSPSQVPPVPLASAVAAPEVLPAKGAAK